MCVLRILRARGITERNGEKDEEIEENEKQREKKLEREKNNFITKLFMRYLRFVFLHISSFHSKMI